MKTFKRFFALTLAAVSLLSFAACSGADTKPENETTAKPEETVTALPTGNFTFTTENYPRMGGSLAAKPLGQAVTASVLSVTREEADGMISFTGSTTDNYNALVDGKFDILLAYEPSEQALAYAKEKGFEWEMTAVGADALVFICSRENNVNSLTTQQIKDIYTGKITKWNEVGGADTAIIPYQRNKDSGSQTLFDKIIDLGDDLIEPAKDQKIGSMIGLLEAVADYENSADALGYTVYYYLTNMEGEKLNTAKILAVDGVQPTNDTIASGAYPFVNDFYVVIPKDTPEDAPARILYNWICSEQGRQLVAQEGYVAR